MVPDVLLSRNYGDSMLSLDNPLAFGQVPQLVDIDDELSKGLICDAKGKETVDIGHLIVFRDQLDRYHDSYGLVDLDILKFGEADLSLGNQAKLILVHLGGSTLRLKADSESSEPL